MQFSAGSPAGPAGVSYDPSFPAAVGTGRADAEKPASLGHLPSPMPCNVVKLEEKSHTLTEFGSLILDYDIGCNLNLTINLLHYFLVNQIYDYSQKSDSFYFD